MTIKLIASDMDDTLLNRECQISPRNAQAIRQAVAAGVVFLLATGRMYKSVKPFADSLELDVPLVTYNGALVKGSRSGEVFYEKPLELSTALAALAYCKEHQYYVQVYIGDQMFIKEHNDFSAMYTKIAGIEAVALGEAVYEITTSPYKLLVMTPAATFAAAWSEFAEHFAGSLDITSSKDNFLELMAPGVNKWQAVQAVARTYGLQDSEIMCIGDSNNDLSMIQNAGLGVAVANAKPAVQAAAKLVTAAHDQDGVALALESILTQQIKVKLV
ncbi:MAG: Cof-type HAD-IIB family hydrolase [Acidaminococcaceae bacterium]